MTDGSTTRVDCHVKIISDRVVERARAAGIDVLVYAPHFTRIEQARASAEAYSTEDVLVVPARELFTGSWRNRRHVLALGLESAIPDFIPLEATMAELDSQDATVLAPHPEFATVSLTKADIVTYRDQIDAVEIFNPKHLPWQNSQARAIAETVDLPPFTSSYAHLGRSVGAAYTEFDAPIESEAALLEALQDGVSRRVVYERGWQRFLTSVTEMAHLFYENSWQKADRLFLSGMESTHPRHIAYNGRFEDLSVY
ncbi:MAG: PHP-associated domain-containing protein [Natrialbaceae archaeon]|nr:PHP-associated domain-containing protein [Natrialbaceae archaeon]